MAVKVNSDGQGTDIPSFNKGRQTAQATSPFATADGSAQTDKNCTSPEEVFTIATALTALFACNLTQHEMQTLINLLTLVVSGLSTIVTQRQICKGIIVEQTESV